MKKVFKIIIYIFIAVAIVGYGAFSGLKPIAVDITKVSPKDIDATFTEQGYVSASSDFNVYPDISGNIIKVMAKKDTYIKMGDPILKIDDADFLYQKRLHESTINGYKAQIANAVTEEKNMKEDYKNNISKLNADLKSIEGQRKTSEANRLSAPSPDEQLKLIELSINQVNLQLSYATEEYNKVKTLYEVGSSSENDVRIAKNNVDVLENQLSQLKEQQSIRKSQSDALAKQYNESLTGNDLAAKGEKEYFDSLVASIKSQIDSFTKNIEKGSSVNTVAYYHALIEGEQATIDHLDQSISDCVVKAQMDGFISELPAKNLSTVTPQTCIATIKTEAQYIIETTISTRNSNDVKKGMAVELVQGLRTNDNTFTGVISDISSFAESKTSALGVDERRVKVKITPDSTAPLLGDGYDVDVKFFYYNEKNKISVPNAAVFKNGDEDFVFKVVNNKAVATPIKVDIKLDLDTVIKSGVNEGDLIIYDANIEGLKDGVKVSQKK